MSTYIYKARDTTGKLVKGTMEAKNQEELIDKLHKMGYMTTRVTEALPELKIESIFAKLKMISAEDMIMFNVQLSNMINAGISMLSSLTTLARQIENRRLKDILMSITSYVEGGDAFSKSLTRHPKVFPPIFINMVKAGEASGQLDVILARYALFCEQQEDLKQKIRGALFYPIILLVAGLIVVLFIVTTIIPQFAKIFIDAGVPLPVPTLILYKTGMAIKNYWPFIGLLTLVIWLGISRYANTEKGRFALDGFKLKIPVIGSLFRKTAISRFSRTLGTLLASGVPILHALDIVKDTIGNEILTRVVKNARTAVERGERVAGPLKISEEFPPDTIQMITVGEETGNLDKMLYKIADFYDQSLGYAIRKLTVVIEPLFLLIMGSMVGFIMASLILPIFDMLKVLRH